MIENLIKKNRSYRRFNEDFPVDNKMLFSFIESARLSPSPRNQQALKFIISNSKEFNEKIFPCLAWAAALPDWEGPVKGERPSSYIIILGDNSVLEDVQKSYHEVASGIVAQSIMLHAAENDLGGCMIAAIKRKPLRESLKIDKKYEILLVLAIGKPIETIVIEDMPDKGNYNYWRDNEQVHHVPKRSLKELIIKIK